MNNELIKIGDDYLHWMHEHDTAILTGGAIVTMAGALITSNLATAKTVREFDRHPEWDTKDKILAAVPRYIGPTALAGVSAYCSIRSENLNAARLALADGVIRYYERREDAIKKSIEKEMSKSKAEKIEQDACKEDFEKNAPKGEWEETGRGRFHVYEPWHGRKFNTTLNELERARNEYNKHVLSEDFMDFNDFYHELHLSPIESASHEGHNAMTGLLEFNLSHFEIEEVDGVMEPVCYIQYVPNPRTDYVSPNTVYRERY